MTNIKNRKILIGIFSIIFVFCLALFAVSYTSTAKQAKAATTLANLSCLTDNGDGSYSSTGGGNGWRFGYTTMTDVTIGNSLDFTVSAGIKLWSEWNDADGRIGLYLNYIDANNHLSVYFKSAQGSIASSEIVVENYVNGVSSFASCWPTSNQYVTSSEFSTLTVRCYYSGGYKLDITYSGSAGSLNYTAVAVNGTGLAGQTSGNPTSGVVCVMRDCTYNNVSITAGSSSGGGGEVTPDVPSVNGSALGLDWSLPGAWSSTTDSITTVAGSGDIWSVNNVAYTPQTMTGTKYSWEITAHTATNGTAKKWGIIPYYQDANNYIIIWAEWTSTMFEKLVIFDTVNGGKVNSSDTTWTDSSVFTGFISGRQYDSTKDTTIKVERNNNLYTVYFNGHQIVSYNCTSGNANNGAGNSLGFCAVGDVTTATSAKLVNTDTPTFGYYWDYDASIWVTTSSNITIGNKNTVENTNIISATNKVTVAEYTMSVTMQGTDGYTENDKGLGIVPWMQDSSNYILIRLSWQKNHSTHADKLLNVAVIEINNGATTSSDNWMDYSQLECAQLKANTMCKLVVKRIVDSANAQDKYEIYVNGELVRTYATAFSYGKTANQKIGLYAWEDYVTFSNVLVEEGVDGVVGGLYEDKEVFGNTVRLNTDVWSVENGTLVGKNTTWMENYATMPTNLTGDYVFEATVKGSGVSTDTTSNEIQFGFIPWYVDSQNYILVMLKWDSIVDEEALSHKTVDVNGLYDVHIIHVHEGTIPAWNDYWIQDPLYDYKASTLKPSDEITVRIEKTRNLLQPNNDTYKIYINDEYIRQVDYKASVNNTGASHVGVHTLKDTNAVISAMSVSPYVAKTDTPTVNTADNKLYTTPDFVDLYTGTFNGKYYIDGVAFTGIKSDDGKYYSDGTVYTGKVVVNDVLYDVVSGAMTLLSGEYEGKTYNNGVIVNGVYNNKYYVNGLGYTGMQLVENVLYDINDGTMTAYTGVYSSRYYEGGALYTGMKVVDGKFYSIADGVMTLQTGIYENKYYEAGVLFTGKRVIENKLYDVTDGVMTLFSGIYDGKNYEAGVEITPTLNASDNKLYTSNSFTTLFTGEFEGKYYEAGVLFNGQKEIDGKLYAYVDGEKTLFTGVKDDKYYFNGTLYTGVAEVNGKVYDVANGVMTAYNGEYVNKYYEAGSLYNGQKEIDGVVYNFENGLKSKYTGVYNNKYYSNGTLFTGIAQVEETVYTVSNGEMTLYTGYYASKYYEAGVLFNGQKEIDGIVYGFENGVQSIYTGEFNGKYYVNGTVSATIIVASNGKVYTDGNLSELYTGIYNGKYYEDGELFTGYATVDGILYNVTDGTMTVYTGVYDADNKYYDGGELYTGIKVVSGKRYKIVDGVMTLLTGVYENKYYNEGSLYTGKVEISGVMYDVKNGVMTLFTGNYNNIDFVDGTAQITPTLNSADGKVYTNGYFEQLYTGLFDNKYYENGVGITGYRDVQGLMYNITNGEMALVNGEYNGKIYKDGTLLSGEHTDGKVYVDGVIANGSFEDKVYANGELVNGTINGKTYVDGELVNGVHTDGKVYENGTLLSGKYTDGKVYFNGQVLTGIFSDGKYYSNGTVYTGNANGVEYQDGLAFNGIKNGKMYVDGVFANGELDGIIYVDGAKYNGLYIDNKFYADGILFTGEKDNVCYQDGELYTGVLNGKRYENGTLYNGQYKNLYYVNGEKMASGNVIVSGIAYEVEDGVMRKYTGVLSGKYYEVGELFTGTALINSQLFSVEDGIMTAFTGTYDEKLHVDGDLFSGFYSGDNKLYSLGVLYNGTNPEDNKVYVDGELFTGVYDDERQYVNGALANGNYNGKFYENGLETINPDDGFVDTEGGGNVANDIAKALVPYGIIALCFVCVFPFFVNMLKKGIYKYKK